MQIPQLKGWGVLAKEILGESMRVQMSGCCHGSSTMFSESAALSPPPPISFRSSYLVTNLMGADLNNIVKFQKLSDEHVQFLIYQLLRGLKVVLTHLAVTLTWQKLPLPC